MTCRAFPLRAANRAFLPVLWRDSFYGGRSLAGTGKVVATTTAGEQAVVADAVKAVLPIQHFDELLHSDARFISEEVLSPSVFLAAKVISAIGYRIEVYFRSNDCAAGHVCLRRRCLYLVHVGLDNFHHLSLAPEKAQLTFIRIVLVREKPGCALRKVFAAAPCRQSCTVAGPNICRHV